MTKRILFQDTSFRDGFQSIFGARAFTSDFIPAVEALSRPESPTLKQAVGRVFSPPSCTVVNPLST